MSFFTLFFIGFMFLVLLAGFFWFFLDSSRKEVLLASRSHDFTDAEASLDIVRDEVNELLFSTESFRKTLYSTLDVLGIENVSNVPRTSAYGEISSLLSVKSESMAEISKLESLRTALDSSVPVLDSFGRKFYGQKELMADIPSIWPLKDVHGRVTLTFGVVPNPFTGFWYIHRGADFGFGLGVPIVATANGTVVKKAYSPDNYGYYIDIQHKYGFKTRYAHMQRQLVSVGQKVSQGEVIGTMGDSGYVTGVHLHYEVMLADHLVDPITFLDIRNDTSLYLVPDLREKFIGE